MDTFWINDYLVNLAEKCYEYAPLLVGEASSLKEASKTGVTLYGSLIYIALIAGVLIFSRVGQNLMVVGSLNRIDVDRPVVMLSVGRVIIWGISAASLSLIIQGLPMIIPSRQAGLFINNMAQFMFGGF